MSYEFYKVVHLLGILLLFTALGGSAMLALRGGTDEERKPFRKLLMATHGTALLIIFVAGFGLMARKGMMGAGWPGWIYVKLGVWLVLGGAVTYVRKQPQLGKIWYFVFPLIGAVAAYSAVFKPGA